MTVSVVFAIAGVIALLFGIVGGGIKAKEIEVPLLPIWARITTIVIGIVLIGATFWLENDNAAQIAQIDNPSQATSTDSPEKLASESLAEAKNWNLIAGTEFASGAWPKDSLDEENWKGIETITTNGTYLVTINYVGEGASDGFWIIPILEQVSDFYLTLEAKLIEGNNDNSYGLIFRSDGSEPPGYVFRVFQKERKYDIQIIDSDWKELTGETPSPHILQDESNRLTVIAKGSELYFFINDKFVHHVSDNQISRGSVGLRIGVDKGTELVAEFDNFELRTPK
jgi:3-keto-disaccharide hydrolase